MIYWLQTVLGKHLKWLFITLLFVIIVSFVFTIGAARGLGEPDTEVKRRVFYGFDLNNPSQIAHLEKGAILSQIMGTAPMLFGLGGQEGLLLGRAALLHIANQLEIPSPTEEALTHYLKNDISFFKNDKNEFDPTAYKRFTDWAYSTPEFGQVLTTQLVEEDFRISQVKPLLSGQDVLPYEAEYQLALAKTKWVVDIATLNIQDISMPELPDEAALKAFYDANTFRYVSPTQRGLTYVLFKTQDYAPLVPTPDQEALKSFYERHHAHFSKPNAEGNLENTPFELANLKEVEALYRDDKGYRLATEAAEDFVISLYEEATPYGSQAFSELLDKNKLKLSTLPPFDQGSIPTAGPFAPGEFTQAFTLDATRYYSDAFPVATGAGIYFLDREIAERIQPYEAVQAQVLADYKTERAQKIFSEKGITCYQALIAANTIGQSFAEAAKAQNLNVTPYDEFDLENPPTQIPGPVLMELPRITPGTISSMITVGDTGYFLHARGKVVPHTLDEAAPEIQAQLKELREITQLLGRAQFIQELITRGLDGTEEK